MSGRAVLSWVRDCFGALDRVAALARALELANKLDLNFDLPRALQAAQLLDIVLKLDARTPVRARVLAGGLVCDLVSALGTDYPMHRSLALNRAAVGARDLAQALNPASGGVLDSDDASDCSAATELDLSRDLGDALASCAALLRALADPVLDRYCDITHDLARYRDLALGLARYLDSHSVMPGAVDAEVVQSLPVTMRMAVWLLPRRWQARYSEEYRAELAELPLWERPAYARQALKEAAWLHWVLAGTECPPDHARVEG